MRHIPFTDRTVWTDFACPLKTVPVLIVIYPDRQAKPDRLIQLPHRDLAAVRRKLPPRLLPWSLAGILICLATRRGRAGVSIKGDGALRQGRRLDNEVGHGRKTLGVIDGALTQFAVALVLLPITIAAVLARPNLLTAQIDEIQDMGFRGGLLAPGPFFALGFLSLLISASFMPADGAMMAMGESVFAATTEGQFWMVASLVAPLFFVAIGLGLIFFLSAVIWRLKRRSLEASLRAGLYSLFGIVCVISVVEPVSIHIGPGGTNAVFEPAVGALVASWIIYFHARALSGPLDHVVSRVGAALLTAAFCMIAVVFAYGS